MEKFLNIGFLAIIIAGVTRYFVSSQSGYPFVSFQNIQEWELWLYGLSIFWFVLAFWNTFFRRRCPECRSCDYSFQGSEEIDRWVGTKQVRERVGDKSYANRNVSTTFVKIRTFFKCLQCGNSWSETMNQEKN